MKVSKYYVSQVDEMDCGVACLSMVLCYYGSSYPLARLREMMKTTKDGTTALAIVKVAQKLKFDTRAVKADERFFEDDVTFPFIIHVIKDERVLHITQSLGVMSLVG